VAGIAIICAVRSMMFKMVLNGPLALTITPKRVTSRNLVLLRCKKMNEFLRHHGYSRIEQVSWNKPVMDGNILVTADGYRWRIETEPKLPDILRVGDTIRTSYNTGGLVIGIHKQNGCSCPYSKISTTKVCQPRLDGDVTEQYHIPVVYYSIVYVDPSKEKQKKSGEFKDGDYNHGWLNEFVAFDGKILTLFEMNKDEVFIVESKVRLEKPMQLKFM